MKKVIRLISLIVVCLSAVPAFAQTSESCNLPEVNYLGTAGTFSANEGMKLVVKRLRPFRFEFVESPYRTSNERVWEVDENVSYLPTIYDNEIDLGQWGEGTEITVQVVDDDYDSRMTYVKNTKGSVFTEFEPELSYEFTFTVTELDYYTLVSEDSIGVYNICFNTVTPTPTVTPTTSPTPTPNIKTPTPAPTPFPTPFVTPTDEPTSLTPTSEPERNYLYLPSLYR